jgi:hypothetical protein
MNIYNLKGMQMEDYSNVVLITPLVIAGIIA